MNFEVNQPSIDSSNYKLERIRKNILHDVLQYNLEASNNKRRQQKQSAQRQQIMFEDMLKHERQTLQKQEQSKRLMSIEKRKMLHREYDREVQMKKQRQEQERKYNDMYARVEKQHQIYSNDRRIYDLERIYNRRGYNARIVEGNNRSERVKTQPLENHGNYGDYSGRREKREKRDLSLNQIKVPQGYQDTNNGEEPEIYRDSLDQLQVRDNLTPQNKNYGSIARYQNTPSNQQFNGINKKVSFI